jgi:hypothetical protein
VCLKSQVELGYIKNLLSEYSNFQRVDFLLVIVYYHVLDIKYEVNQIYADFRIVELGRGTWQAQENPTKIPLGYRIKKSRYEGRRMKKRVHAWAWH